ncbi:hypothetical protein ACS0TY_021949 [Phlomoides rotata]
MLPSNLAKLTLSGLGYAWEDMRPIASLKLLKVLKLQSYAFRGQTRVDTDLVHWRADDYSHFLSLWFLTIRHCFKLKEIPWRSFSRVCTTELVDCHPSASEQMPEDYVARVYFSWEGA